MNTSDSTVFDIRPWGHWSVLWVDSDQIDACIERYRYGGVDAVGVSPGIGFRDDDISFLRRIPNLRGVVMPRAGKYDLKVLAELPLLRLLVLAEFTQAVNASIWPHLHELSVDWHTRLVLPSAGTPLTNLSMWKYKGGTDLAGLPLYPNLENLFLAQGSLQSLDGVERFRALRTIECVYMPKLRRVGAIGSLTVEAVRFQNCPQIEDLAALAACPELKSLRLSKCAPLPNLSFLDDFSKLEDFRFVNTNIIDGNLKPLLRLKSIGSLDKRHYRPSVAEVKQRIGDTSP